VKVSVVTASRYECYGFSMAMAVKIKC